MLKIVTSLYFFYLIINFVNAHEGNHTNDALAGPKITYGTPTYHRPYQIQLLLYRQFVCSGSILNSRWVLTAAHCVSEAPSQFYQVLAGARILYARGENTAQLRNVEKTIRNPYFQHDGTKSFPNDVALIKIAGKFYFTNKVQPINVGYSSPKDGKIISVTGWGQNEYNQLGYGLREIKMKIVNLETCNWFWGGGLNTAQLCVSDAYRSRGSSACNGDSGGPLVYQGAVVGVASFVTEQCSTVSAPNVFTNVAFYRNWIYQTMKIS